MNMHSCLLPNVPEKDIPGYKNGCFSKRVNNKHVMIIAMVIYIIKTVLSHFPFLKPKMPGTGMHAALLATTIGNTHRLRNLTHFLNKKLKRKVKRSKINQDEKNNI